MQSPLARAELLYHQSRYDLAEQEVRHVLGETPQHAGAHALLAMCLVQQEKFDEAEQEVGQAIVAAPDWAYPHYCRSIVQEERKRLAAAESAAREAIALAPLDPDYHARLAATLFQQGKWKACLDACLEGLSHDAEHAQCGHIRAMALTKLGRQIDAIATVDAALARDPEDAMAHTNKGWAFLHQRKPREALEHFREALRISPTYDYAKSGIVEALKARNPIYRWMLVYFLWMSRLSDGARWGVVIGGYFLGKFLYNAARVEPSWRAWIKPILALYLIFVLLTWFAIPLFNLLLRFNKFGWYALSPEQRTSANLFGACLIVGVAGFVAFFVTNLPQTLLLAAFGVGIALPVTTIFYCDSGWPRRSMIIFTLGMTIVGAGALACASIGDELTYPLTTIFLIGFIATPWLANYLVMAKATR